MSLEADKVLQDIIHRTPLVTSYTLNRMVGANVYLKLENLQKTGSFKVRGAYYAIWKSRAEREFNLCVTASSGNHAQGVAYASRKIGVNSIIVMPVHTPMIKVSATKGYGAEVILYGDTYDEAYEKAIGIAEERGALFVHPFNDPKVIAGQGTIGLELLRDLDRIDSVVVPVGGGGLISGIATVLKKRNRRIKIYGVQASGSNAIYLSLKRGRITVLDKVDTIADGVIVKAPGDLTFKLISELVDDVVLVDDDEIARAMLFLIERCKIVAEPAGAMSIAALLANKLSIEGNVVAIISGGNVDMPLLIRVINRALILERRLVKLKGILPDRPGYLKKVIDIVAGVNGNIVTVEHDRNGLELRPGVARVEILIEVPGVEVVDKIIQALKERGFDFKIV
ncbi:MAG: threonine ammonia-lyase [Thermoprotei archaeon]|nr:MAG: threonine ammonia-lyase [Thermoprotei archaeon]